MNDNDTPLHLDYIGNGLRLCDFYVRESVRPALEVTTMLISMDDELLALELGPRPVAEHLSSIYLYDDALTMASMREYDIARCLISMCVAFRPAPPFDPNDPF